MPKACFILRSILEVKVFLSFLAVSFLCSTSESRIFLWINMYTIIPQNEQQNSHLLSPQLLVVTCTLSSKWTLSTHIQLKFNGQALSPPLASLQWQKSRRVGGLDLLYCSNYIVLLGMCRIAKKPDTEYPAWPDININFEKQSFFYQHSKSRLLNVYFTI